MGKRKTFLQQTIGRIYSLLILFQTESISGGFFKIINFFSSEFQLGSESLRHNPPMETQQKVPISGFIVKAFRFQREKLTVIASSFQLKKSCLKVKTINLQTANLVEGKTYLSLRHLWEKQSFQCHLGDYLLLHENKLLFCCKKFWVSLPLLTLVILPDLLVKSTHSSNY